MKRNLEGRRWFAVFMLAMLVLVLGAGAAFAVRPGQQTKSTLARAVQEGKLELVQLTGHAPQFYEPMVQLWVKSRSATPLWVEIPEGMILKSKDPQYCDLALMERTDEPLYFEGVSTEPVLFPLYAFCLQLVPGDRKPGERAFPPLEATYTLTEEVASPAVREVLARIRANELQETLAAQLAVWMEQNDIKDLQTLREKLKIHDLTTHAPSVALLRPPKAPKTDAQPTSATTSSTPGATVTLVASPTVAPAGTITPESAATPSGALTPGETPATSGGSSSNRLLIIGLAVLAGAMVVLGGVFWLLTRGSAGSAAVEPPPSAERGPSPASKPKAAPQPKAAPPTPKAPLPSAAQPDTAAAVKAQSHMKLVDEPETQSLNRGGAKKAGAEKPAATPPKSARPHLDADWLARLQQAETPQSPRTPPAAAGAEPVSVASSKPSPAAGSGSTPVFVPATQVIGKKPAAGSGSEPPSDLQVLLCEKNGGKIFRVPAGGGVLSRAGVEAIKFIALPGAGLSTPHAMIEQSPHEGEASYSIKDLRSGSGTLLNGALLEERSPLRDGDRITVGTLTLVFFQQPARLQRQDSASIQLRDASRWLLSDREVAFIQLDKLNDIQISAPHAYLEVRSQEIIVRDLHSTNGTYLHGKSIDDEEVGLVHDDILQLGRTEFEVNTNQDYMPKNIGRGENALEKVRSIKAGGMARVYLYRSLTNGRQYAVKVPRLGRWRRTDEGRTFQDAYADELKYAKEIARLPDRPVHSHIVRIERIEPVTILFCRTTVECLVMEYVDGPDLGCIISNTGILPHQAAEIGWRVADALGFLHDRAHLIHCDVKPSNILINRKGEVFLHDFGITVRSGDPVVGYMTPGYWPCDFLDPDGKTVDPTLDVFSFGALMYELLTRQPLFVDPERDCQDPSSIPEKARRDVLDFTENAKLAEIVARCVQPDPQDRFQDMQSIQAVLHPLRRAGVDLGELVDNVTTEA